MSAKFHLILERGANIMKRSTSVVLPFVILLMGLGGCAGIGTGPVWTTLLDGDKGLENFNRAGEANWTAVDGVIQATQSPGGSSHLVSKNSYKDFILRVEFWTSDDGNSGVHMRCEDPSNLSSSSCYEVNIYDQREDQTYSTGAIVNFAPVYDPMPKAGGKWNTYDITVKGTRLTVILNGVRTAEVDDGKLSSGPIALQYAAGAVKFRKVQIKPL